MNPVMPKFNAPGICVKESDVNVKDILSQWLKQNGYDGLISDIGDCTCGVDDIACCGEPLVFCVATKKAK
jgi:hypothetical protein